MRRLLDFLDHLSLLQRKPQFECPSRQPAEPTPRLVDFLIFWIYYSKPQLNCPTRQPSGPAHRLLDFLTHLDLDWKPQFDCPSRQPAGPTRCLLGFLDHLSPLAEASVRLSQSSARRDYAPPLGLLGSFGSTTGSRSSIVPVVSPQGLRTASLTSWLNWI